MSNIEKAIKIIEDRIKQIDYVWRTNIGYLKETMSTYLHQLEIKHDLQTAWECSVVLSLTYNRKIADTCNVLRDLWNERNMLEKVLKALTEEDCK